MNKTILATVISSGLLLTACGGGTNSTTSNLVAQYTLKGNVPGTTIEAYCDDGSFHTVSSDSSVATPEHPFSLSSLPVNTPCRVVIITHPVGEIPTDANKVVTPVEFQDANGTVSLGVTSTGGDVDLGNSLMQVNLTRVNDANNDGVLDIIDTKQVVALNDNDATVGVAVGITDPFDINGNGIVNAYEDTDGDGILNHDDDDANGNGIVDTQETNIGDDLDGDGVPNSKDVDIDNDGIKNINDPDIDNDGIPNTSDQDNDNNGVVDSSDTSTDGYKHNETNETNEGVNDRN